MQAWNMTNIFIDTSAFKAVFDQSDDFHDSAWKYWEKVQKEQITFICTNYILDEIFTLFRSQLGKESALVLRDKLALSPKSFKIVLVGKNDEKIAWDYFERLPGRGVSFTDCTSFAVMKRLNLTDAFTFDNDFKAAGFKTLPA